MNRTETQAYEDVRADTPWFTPWVTWFLVAANVLVFIGMVLAKAFSDAHTLILWGVLWAPAVEAGQYWRLVSSVFLHGNPLHLAFNAYMLYWLGGYFEYFLGRSRMLLAFLLLGILANIPYVALLLVEGTRGSDLWMLEMSLGASGALFGLAGVLMLQSAGNNPEMPLAFHRMIRHGIVPLIVINLFLGWVLPQVNNAVHIGGLIAGVVLGWLIRFVPAFKRWLLGSDTANWICWGGAGAVMIWAALGMTLDAGQSARFAEGLQALQEAQSAMKRWDNAAAEPLLERSLEALPDYRKGWFQLGWCRLGAISGGPENVPAEVPGAAAAFRRYLELSGNVTEGPQYMLRLFAEAVLAWDAGELSNMKQKMMQLKELNWPDSVSTMVAMLDQAGASSEALITLEKELTAIESGDDQVSPDRRAAALNALAWFLLTSKETDLQDVSRALELAQQAVELSKNASILDTLAEAYYRSGDIEAALESERDAIKLNPENRAYFERQLERFQSAIEQGRSAE